MSTMESMDTMDTMDTCTLVTPEAPAKVGEPTHALPFVLKDARGKTSTALLDLAQARAIVADLLVPSPRFYWSDFLTSALIGWSAFAVAVAAPFHSWVLYAAGLVAVLALYRALLFTHELTHLRSSALPGFRVAWDLLVGIPMLLPAVIYLGVHNDHHRPATYGTSRDPEYLPFAGKKAMITIFFAHTFLLPLALALRFLVFAPLGLLLPSLHGWLERCASALAMNPQYRRAMKTSERTELRRTEIALLLVWGLAITFCVFAGCAWKAALVHLCVLETIVAINCLRTLGAHRYTSTGESMPKHEQVLDSIDTPGNVLNALWAPVGLRYHALHHFFPTLPYHNLSTAYIRLFRALPQNAAYRQTRSKSLVNSLVRLWKGSNREMGGMGPIGPMGHIEGRGAK